MCTQSMHCTSKYMRGQYQMHMPLSNTRHMCAKSLILPPTFCTEMVRLGPIEKMKTTSVKHILSISSISLWSRSFPHICEGVHDKCIASEHLYALSYTTQRNLGSRFQKTFPAKPIAFLCCSWQLEKKFVKLLKSHIMHAVYMYTLHELK